MNDDILKAALKKISDKSSSKDNGDETAIVPQEVHETYANSKDDPRWSQFFNGK